MGDIYCGSKRTIPKGKRRGSMAECAEAGQIRYFGVKKVDQKLVDSIEKSKKEKKQKEDKKLKLQESYIKLAGKIKKMKDRIDAEKDKDKKTDLQKELKSLDSKKQKVGKQITDLN